MFVSCVIKWYDNDTLPLRWPRYDCYVISCKRFTCWLHQKVWYWHEENMDEHTQFAMRYHQKLTINANSFVCKQCRQQNNGYECHFNLFKKYKNSYFVITSRTSFIVPRNPIVSLNFCTCMLLKNVAITFSYLSLVPFSIHFYIFSQYCTNESIVTYYSQ